MFLAGFGLVACVIAAVLFLVEASHRAGSTSATLRVAAAAAAVGAVIAIVDLAVLVRRRRRHSRAR
jgi:hypothetical protein